MNIHFMRESTNKAAAAKATAIVALIPIIIIASIVGLFINATVVGYIWIGALCLAIGGFILFVVGALIFYALTELYDYLYGVFS